MRTNKQYFFYYLKDNILLLDTFDYLEDLASDVVDYFNDWGLIKDNKVNLKNSMFKEYVIQRVENDFSTIKKLSNKYKSNFISFYKPKNKLGTWSEFFDEPEKVVKKIKSIIKKKSFNFTDINNNMTLFKNVNGTFNHLPLLIPNGEDIEFLEKKLKKVQFCY